jgi:hypothetical protein
MIPLVLLTRCLSVVNEGRPAWGMGCALIPLGVLWEDTFVARALISPGNLPIVHNTAPTVSVQLHHRTLKPLLI